jgi:putative endonuclease
MFFIYILRCRDGRYYVGSTHDVGKRLQVHQSGRGPAFTASRLPVALIYQESLPTLAEAVRRERQLKGWSRAKKEALVAGDQKRLRQLSASRSSLPPDEKGTQFD